MKLSFLGAAGEVTGSATLLQTATANVLVDFGLHQGSREIDRRNDSDALKRVLGHGALDAVVLTHAHLDHCGRLPLLAKLGFRPTIHCSPPTMELAPLVLRDSAEIHVADAARDNRHRRPTVAAIQPLYEPADAERVIETLSPIAFDAPTSVADGVVATLRRNAHILGSAFIELRVRDGGVERTIVFSGDVGHAVAPISRAADMPTTADVLVIESTYGDRDHRDPAATIREFGDILERAVNARGKVLIPAFAIGRTQTILWLVSETVRLRGLPRFPVIIDSPMAVDVTAMHARWRDELVDAPTRAKLAAGGRLVTLPDVRPIRDAQESRALNGMDGPMVIIATSGMCTGGRIMHHLRHNLARPTTHVVIVGFQAHGTVGRRLVERARTVEIFGDTINVRAQVHTLNGLSAHAGRTELLNWANELRDDRPTIFVNHGEDGPRRSLADGLRAASSGEPLLPRWNQEFTL